MDEGHLKAATLTHVREATGRRRKPIVTAEFSLGSSGVRADLAVFDEMTIGFEIKSARDTLKRLPAQMMAYSRYFDHVIAIVAPQHLRNITYDTLHGASLWTFDAEGTLSVVHDGSPNAVDPSALDDVLTQAELRCGDYRAAMEARYGATSRQFWKTVSRRPISHEDLPLLSRFADRRAQAGRLAAEKEAWWADWLAAQPSQSSSVSSAAAGAL